MEHSQETHEAPTVITGEEFGDALNAGTLDPRAALAGLGAASLTCAHCGVALHISHEERPYLVDDSGAARCPVASAAIGPDGFDTHAVEPRAFGA